jgi:flagellar biosynthesis protein FlhG
VLSGKGGVGKTVLAYNLAERASSLGNRVLLVDADYGMGNLHILANLSCEFGLAQFAAGELSLREAVTRVTDRLDLLANVGGQGTLDPNDGTAAALIVKQLRAEGRSYDLVLIDHSSGVSQAATVIAHGSDINLLILVPELTSISDCYGLFKTLVEANPSIDARFLVNRTESTDEAEYIHQKFGALTERFLGQPPEYQGHLLEDSIYRRSIGAQTAIAGLGTDTPGAQALTALAGRLFGRTNGIVRTAADTLEIAIKDRMATADIRE